MKSGKKGIVFIPDISGYSRFVSRTDNTSGAKVISEMLASIIESNYLAFSISEIEGDAILFYRYGYPYPIPLILNQYEAMLKSFKAVVERLVPSFPQVRLLSLKLIVHYGPIEEFVIDGRRKLYGNTVVEAHKLLKNSMDKDTYVLITEAYVKAEKGLGYNTVQLCENFDEVGTICYQLFSYQSYEKLKRKIPQIHISS